MDLQHTEDESSASVLLYIRRHPGCSNRDIEAALGVKVGRGGIALPLNQVKYRGGGWYPTTKEVVGVEMVQQIDGLRSLAVSITRDRRAGWQETAELLYSVIATLSDDQIARELQAGMHRRVLDEASAIANLQALMARTPEQEFEATIGRKPDLTQPDDVRDLAVVDKALHRHRVAATMALAPALLAAAQVFFEMPCYFAGTRQSHCWDDGSESPEIWCGPCQALWPLYGEKVKS